MILCRLLFGLLLGLVLVTSSITVAVARGQMASSWQAVICTGFGVTTLSLDSRGRPLGPVHPCPDCLGSLLTADLPEAPAGPALPGIGSPVPRLDGAQFSPASGPLSPRARGPPVGRA